MESSGQCPPCYEKEDGKKGCKPVQCDPDSTFDPSVPGCCRLPEHPIECDKCHTRLLNNTCHRLECEEGFYLNTDDCSCAGDPDSPPEWPICDPEGQCPAGMECKDGHCVPTKAAVPYKLPTTPPVQPGKIIPDPPEPPVQVPRCGPCESSVAGKCVRKQCPKGATLNLTNCTCEPRRCPKTYCPKGFRLNTLTCTCEPEPGETCRKTCSSPLVLNRETCTCEPKRCPKTHCPKGFKLNTATCTCEPEVRCRKTCGPPLVLNREKCVCERRGCPQTTCPKGYRLNTATCKCEPEQKERCRKTCSPPRVLNPEKCTCEKPPQKTCNKSCRAPLRLDPRTCQCVQAAPSKRGTENPSIKRTPERWPKEWDRIRGKTSERTGNHR